MQKKAEQHTTELKHDKSTQDGEHKPVHSGTTYAVLAKDHILMQSAIVRSKEILHSSQFEPCSIQDHKEHL